MSLGRVALILAAAALAAPLAAQAQPNKPVYKCPTKTGPVYSDKPCSGGKRVGAKEAARESERQKKPPQDRAEATQKATRPAAVKEQCATLETKIKIEEARLKALPQPATATDEKDVVNDRMEYRKLKC